MKKNHIFAKYKFIKQIKMKTKYGFSLMSISEFEEWIGGQDVARTILFLQMHHTYIPAYIHFDGNNHFEKQRAMRNHHVVDNGWSDIGQHFTIFPDGKISTGRSLERSPACIYGKNSHSLCIENLGNFDIGKDAMTDAQKNAIVRVSAALCKRFNIIPNTDRIVYHHWYDLRNGNRTNGGSYTKSCPGTNFFGGNSVEDCETYFIPLVKAAIDGVLPDNNPPSTLLKYGSVKASRLNIRDGAGTSFVKIGQTTYGAILRIYEEKNNWYRISKSKEEWVYSNYVKDVKRAVVNANTLNVRSGPSAHYHKVASVHKNQEVFIYEEKDGWCRIGIEDLWVYKRYLD
jgi:uncharacterized protein YraI